jgi:hypothetical protein
LEKRLEEFNFLGGQLPNGEDRDIFSLLKDKDLDRKKVPNLYAWQGLISKFSETARAAWTGGASSGKRDKKDKK